MISRAVSRIALCIAVLGLGGCAALTVDVDVYKGPMANVEAIRLHQLSAMAVAARPVLYDLRYLAEEEYCKAEATTRYGTLLDKPLGDCRGRSRVLTDRQFMYARVPDAGRDLVSPQGRTIEATLVLYETRSDDSSRVKDLVEPVLAAFGRSVKQMQSAQAIARHVIRDSTVGELLLKGEIEKTNNEKTDPRKWCRDGATLPLPYGKDFLSQINDDTPWYPKSAPERELSEPRNAVCPPSTANVLHPMPAFFHGKHVSRDAFVVWDRYDPSNTGKTVEDKNACSRLEDTDGLVPANPRETATEGSIRLRCAIIRARDLNEIAFRRAVEILGDKQKLVVLGRRYSRPLAGAAATLISPRVLRLSGKLALQHGQCPDVKEVYEKLFDQFDASQLVRLSDYKSIRDGIAEAMIDPSNGPDFSDGLRKCSESVEKEFNDRFGLLTYPLPDPSLDDTQVDGIISNLARWSAELQSGAVRLDEGGPSLGLVDAVNRFAEPQSPTKAERETVQRTLLYFAQKVVSLGDNDVLLGDSDETRRGYTRVLQSVGNSILSNLDELVRRTSDDNVDNQKRKADSLARASKLISELPPPPTAEEFLQAIQDASLRAEFKKTLVSKAAEADKSFGALRTSLLEEVATLEGEIKSGTAIGALAGPATVCLEKWKKDKPYEKHTGPKLVSESKDELLSVLREEKCNVEISDSLEEFLGQTISDTQGFYVSVDRAIDALNKVPKTTKDEVEKLSAFLGATRPLLDMLPLLPPALPVPKFLFDASLVKHPAMIWDEIDHALQLMHVNHVAAYGRTPYTARIKEAMALVARYRSNTLYLTPATSFLRNSYPSAALRPERAETNLLLPEFMRGSNYTRDQVARAVDGQFWQNVNRVRVNGGGRVNYVVTKDDIGNWYVKGYSADGKEIAESMKNLALFASGPGARATLTGLGKGDESERSKDSGTGGTPVNDASNKLPPKSASEAQFDAFVAAYRKESKALLTKIRAEAATYDKTLLAALKNVHTSPRDEVVKAIADTTVAKYVENDDARKDLLNGTIPDSTTTEEINKKTADLLALLAEYADKRAEALNPGVELRYFATDKEANCFGATVTSTAHCGEKDSRKAGDVQREAETRRERGVSAIRSRNEEVLSRFLSQREDAIDRQRRSLDILGGKLDTK